MGIPSLITRDSSGIAAVQKLRFFPLAITGGKGTRVITEDGRRLLDLSAAWGAASLGYGHPAVVDAVCTAVRNPAGASILSAVQSDAVHLAEEILATLPELTNHKVWFGHSGSDANETAVRVIAAATGRKKVIAFRGAYHGGTVGSMAISGHTAQSHAARSADLTLVDYPDPKRQELSEDIVARLSMLFAGELRPEDVGAVFIEPIQSDGGLILPITGSLAALVSFCRRNGILIVSDEVKVGLARSGEMHCFRHEGFEPDFVCLGKGLGGGLPISALVGPRAIMDHATAFSMQTLHGNPTCTAAARAVLQTIDEERLVSRSAAVGDLLLADLRHLMWRHHCIADVRGRGLAIGIEVIDPSGAPSKALAAKIVYRAFELGAVIYYVGLNSNVLELTPPLILSRAEAAEAVAIIDEAITDVVAGKVSDHAIADFIGW